MAEAPDGSVKMRRSAYSQFRVQCTSKSMKMLLILLVYTSTALNQKHRELEEELLRINQSHDIGLSQFWLGAVSSESFATS
jgi:hypothetical protein